MTSTRRECVIRGRQGDKNKSHTTRSSPTHSQEGIQAQHQIDNERNAGDSSSGGGGSDASEDMQDGTTQRTPHGTPPDPARTPPAGFTPLRGRARTSRLTSGLSECRPRATGIDPRICSAGSEKGKYEQLDEVCISPGRSKQHPSPQRWGPTAALLIFICFMALVAGYLFLQALSSRTEEQKAPKKIKPITEVYEDLILELRGLHQEFSQPQEVWQGLLGQLEAVMVEEPQQPAVLLLAVPDDSRGTATCLAHRLAQAVQYAFEDTRFVMFDTRSSENQDSSSLLKMELDESLKVLAKAHAAVVHNIENLPGPAAMILHAYCDNENAPYKQAVIFLLAEVPGTYEELGYSRLDSLMDTYLARVWGAEADGGLAEKDVSALISRTANSPVLIRPERPARVQKLCPV